jgi:hypothetical protein
MGVVRSWPLIAVILTGSFVTASFPCLAKHHSLRDKMLDFKASHLANLKTVNAAELSHPVFQYLYSDPQAVAKANNEPLIVSWQSYKEQLRGLLAYQLSEDFRVGLNSFKAGPLEQADLEVLPLVPQLQPRSLDITKSRGYGVCFTMTLD